MGEINQGKIMKTLLFTIIMIIPLIGISQEKDNFYTTQKITFVALNIGDYITTKKGLSYDQVKEGNGFVQKMIDTNTFFLFKASATVTTLLLYDISYKQRPKLTKAALLSLNILYGAVVSNNVSVLIKIGG